MSLSISHRRSPRFSRPRASHLSRSRAPRFSCLSHFSRLRLFHLLLLAVLTGCATQELAPETCAPNEETRAGEAASLSTTLSTLSTLSAAIPITRQGRYTLAEMSPEPGQRDLMRQIIEISIPPTLEASVGDALRHVLQRSGFHLCDTAEIVPLTALPLPAPHLHLGPMTLRDALMTLAGPAWTLSVDEVSRQACFTRPETSNNIPAGVKP